MDTPQEPIVELAPREKISLIDLDGEAVERDRLLVLLRKAWRQIPAADRKLILEHYIKNRLGQLPKVILSSRKGDGGPLASSHRLFHCLWVDSCRIFALPGGEPWANEILGHHLAHAYLYATNSDSHQEPRPENALDEEAWERSKRAAAREVAGRWGFDLATQDTAVEWARRTDSSHGA
jgi:hypothetical protein